MILPAWHVYAEEAVGPVDQESGLGSRSVQEWQETHESADLVGNLAWQALKSGSPSFGCGDNPAVHLVSERVVRWASHEPQRALDTLTAFQSQAAVGE